MPRRCSDQPSDQEPPRKKSSSGVTNGTDLKQGEILTDISGKKWKLGKSIGIGGFGEIYQAFDNILRDIKTDKTSHVAKIERHTNGPLFVEINCYLRIAKHHMIEEWKREKKLSFLGMPHYITSGSHFHRDEKYRFLILPQYAKDLEKVLQEKKVFNLKTVLLISSQILDVLEYIHSKGYVHSDIKASNIMLGKQDKKSLNVPIRKTTRVRVVSTRNVQKNNIRKSGSRNLRPLESINYIDDIPYLDEVLKRYNKEYTASLEKQKREKEDKLDQVYLLDYGLASKYLLANGEHRNFCRDERRAHAGTVLFCSRDAHNGVPSRRSDLESLAYNMIYWLTGSLPWLDDIEQPDIVEKKKIKCFKNLKTFLEVSFINDYPEFLLEYFNYLSGLQFEESPDYKYIRNLFSRTIKSYGYKNDSRLDFDNSEIGGSRQKKVKRRVIGCENKKLFPSKFLNSNPLMPLQSNIIFKRPKLRKKVKNKKIKDSAMNWSKILMDPETIIKQATRGRKTMECSEPSTITLSSIDLQSMNPTYAMLEVYNKCKDREFSPRHKGDSGVEIDNIEGYTPAMMNVYRRTRERQQFEYEQTLLLNNNNNNRVSSKSSRGSTRKRVVKRTKRSESPTVQKSSSRTKSQTTVFQKKEIILLKKLKNIPLRRTYSLRG